VFQHLPCRVHSIEFWQANIQNNQIWLQLLALFDPISPISSFSADFPAFVRSKQRGQTEPEYWMIVNH
jgi:hypothetical protein